MKKCRAWSFHIPGMVYGSSVIRFDNPISESEFREHVRVIWDGRDFYGQPNRKRLPNGTQVCREA